MRSGKYVYGIDTRLEWLSTTADQSYYRVRLDFDWQAGLAHAALSVLYASFEQLKCLTRLGPEI